MKKILLPLEDTERSIKALHYVKQHYPKSDTEIVLMMVDESMSYSVKTDAEAQALKELDDKLATIAASLEDYKVTTVSAVGKAGVRITRTAREKGADLIVMTKSSKEDRRNSIGDTAAYVLNNAPCDVVIVSEAADARNEYRGLVYKSAKGTVTLRGQLGDKQSECLLPSVNQDCIYHIDVTVGKVRFSHTAYNPDTRNWDQPPLPGQEVTTDIAAGESRDILVKADSTDGKSDRIRIVNRDMKKEAVFSFVITAAQYDDNGNLIEPEKPKASEAAEAAAAAASVDPEEAMANKATMKIPKIESAEDVPGFEAPEIPTFEPEAAGDGASDAGKGSKGGFFGRLFGRSKKNEDAEPVKPGEDAKAD